MDLSLSESSDSFALEISVTHRQSLTELATGEVLGRRVYPPRSHNIRAVNTIKIPVANKVRPVVFGDNRAIRKLKCLVLDLSGIRVQRKRRQNIVLDVCSTIQENVRIESPQRPQNLHPRGRFVDNIVVGALEIIKDHPVKVEVI